MTLRWKTRCEEPEPQATRSLSALGAAENVIRRSIVLEIVVEETGRSKSGKGFTGPGERTRQESGSASHASAKARVLRSQEHVVASHIIQAGIDGFMGKNRGSHTESTEDGENDTQEGGQCTLSLVRVRESPCWCQNADQVQAPED